MKSASLHGMREALCRALAWFLFQERQAKLPSEKSYEVAAVSSLLLVTEPDGRGPGSRGKLWSQLSSYHWYRGAIRCPIIQSAARRRRCHLCVPSCPLSHLESQSELEFLRGCRGLLISLFLRGFFHYEKWINR